MGLSGLESGMRASEAPPRSSRAPGMHFGHDLLLALTMAIALGAVAILIAR